MATLFKRIRHLQTTGKIRQITFEERLEIGKEIWNRFLQIPNHLYAGKCKSIEPEGEFYVRSYPKIYTEFIDAVLILKFRAKRKRTYGKTFH